MKASYSQQPGTGQHNSEGIATGFRQKALLGLQKPRCKDFSKCNRATFREESTSPQKKHWLVTVQT